MLARALAHRTMSAARRAGAPRTLCSPSGEKVTLATSAKTTAKYARQNKRGLAMVAICAVGWPLEAWITN